MSITNRRYELSFAGENLALTLKSTVANSPTHGQVLVKMAATSLNYRDLLTIQDKNSTKPNLVPFSDGAGVVAAVGEGVTEWKVGDRVAANFFANWVDGPFNPAYIASALGGGGTDGVLAEYAVLEAKSLVRVPDYMSLEEAATLPCAGVTAWHALFERGNIKPGDTVLVQGTGGVALFGLQLASAIGAKVIVTSSSDEKLERAVDLGAWKTINYRKNPDWEKLALEMTEGRGVDHILELGGPDTYDRSIACIAGGGRIAQIGVLTGFASQPNILPLQFKNASVNGICVGSAEHLKNLASFMADHKIHPVIDATYKFEDAQQAYDVVGKATHFGKVVVKVSE